MTIPESHLNMEKVDIDMSLFLKLNMETVENRSRNHTISANDHNSSIIRSACKEQYEWLILQKSITIPEIHTIKTTKLDIDIDLF